MRLRIFGKYLVYLTHCRKIVEEPSAHGVINGENLE